ncbi:MULTISPECIES: hypothetical protein [unclassified Cryobacterium]|uniref:hypothetical protein n=1 Tax=unclassified Cryobacterium TaxID=2649013 RepID=UPI0010696632|nr:MULTISPECIES: hypothetical protein [unclassified Cryobacterium]TFB96553.1 hypothetical protein E3O39_10805 [Cryobacterium sp. MDB2-A-1]TFC12837.1 hypothetical protein E3O35_07965 [Cryobacterium sp. MDB2-A-2]
MTADYSVLPARVEPEPFSTTLRFDYMVPPLHANKKWKHWAPKAAMTKSVRLASKLSASRIPELGKCRVTLTWFVVDKRVRDVDNLWPLVKALCDGLVDAGIVRDDRPEFMEKPAPIIQWLPKTEGPARMELRIEQIA